MIFQRGVRIDSAADVISSRPPPSRFYLTFWKVRYWLSTSDETNFRFASLQGPFVLLY